MAGARRPKMFLCYLCGREYGSKSLPIHIPQCQKMWLAQEEKKPKKDRRPMPQPPKEIAEVAIMGGGGGALTASQIDAMNDAAYSSYDGNLEKCQHCGRTFKPEALAHHAKMCTAARPFRQAGTGLTSASLSAKLEGGAIAGTSREKVDLDNLPNGNKPSPTKSSLKPSSARPPSRMPPSPATPSKPSPSPGGGASGPKSAAAAQQRADKSATDTQRPSGGEGEMAPFCDECGTKFLRSTSKFCSECGTKRAARS